VTPLVAYLLCGEHGCCPVSAAAKDDTDARDGVAGQRTHGEEARQAGLDPVKLAEIDAAIHAHIESNHVAGAVGLISRHGHTGYFEAYGMRDRESRAPMTTDSIFRICSMSKPLVTAAALTLFDEGKFALDDPIYLRLPEWKDVQVAEDAVDPKTGKKMVRLVSAQSPITVRQLMSHSSGLYYIGTDGNPSGSKIKLVGNNKDQTVAELSCGLAKLPLMFQPGTRFQYGFSIDVLGRYVEVLSGKPLDVFLNERLLKPLKMYDTAFFVPPEKWGRIATTYAPSPGGGLEVSGTTPAPREKPKLLLGGAGLVSTVRDYARFCQMLLNRGELDGVRVLKASTVDLMFQNHLLHVTQGRVRCYGLGGASDPDGVYKWGGAAGTEFWVDSKNDCFIVFMLQWHQRPNAAYPDFNRLAKKMLGLPER